jgi:hypothetical protein
MGSVFGIVLLIDNETNGACPRIALFPMASGSPRLWAKNGPTSGSASHLPSKNPSDPSASKRDNLVIVPKKDGEGRVVPNSCDGTMVRIRLFDDRERVLFFKVQYCGRDTLIICIPANILVYRSWMFVESATTNIALLYQQSLNLYCKL